MRSALVFVCWLWGHSWLRSGLKLLLLHKLMSLGPKAWNPATAEGASICCRPDLTIFNTHNWVMLNNQTAWYFYHLWNKPSLLCCRWLAVASLWWWCSIVYWPTATGCWWKASTSTTSWSSLCLQRGTTSKSTCALAGVSRPVVCVCVWLWICHTHVCLNKSGDARQLCAVWYVLHERQLS